MKKVMPLFFFSTVPPALKANNKNRINPALVLLGRTSKNLILFLLVLSSVSAAASLKPSDEQFLIIQQNVEYVFEDSFAQAYNKLSELNDTIEGQPIYRLIYSSILHAQMVDAEDDGQEKTLLQNLDSSIDILKKWVDNNPDDAWGLFFLGSAYGYKSVWYGQNGNWIKSLLAGLKSKSRFSEALQADSTLYDAYTGLGSFHYWSSVKLSKYIPFLPNNRNLGLQELRLATDSSHFSRQAATVGLAWALVNENRLSDALGISRKLMQSTNNGRAALWLMAGIYWRMGNLGRAAFYYDEIIKSLEKTDGQNFYNLIFCHYRKGVCFYAAKNYDDSRTEFEKTLEYDPPGKLKNRLKDTLSKSKDYIKKIDNLKANKQ